MVDYQVFISYRRDGGEYLAGRISDKLRERGFKVFYDVESMRSGTFNTQLLEAIDVCEDFLLVLPPNGLDRCVDEEDWVRKEIVHALENKKNIIPIMMRGFEFPENLPEKIEVVKNYEGVRAASDYFDAVIDRIQSLLVSKAGIESLNSQLNVIENFIKAGMYSQAQGILQQLMISNPSDDNIYFYNAVCLLNGKRPFLLQKNIIEQALSCLDAATVINPKAIYYYFIAYIKHDFYSLKFLNVSPDYQEAYKTAVNKGVNESEVQSMFSLLKVQRPSGF